MILNTPVPAPQGITLGPDGNLWFFDNQSRQIFKVTTSGTFTGYPVLTNGTMTSIVQGPDGNIWFAYFGGGTVGRITPSGTLLPQYKLPVFSSVPADLTVGPDGDVWFVESTSGKAPFKVGKITVDGSVTEYPLPATVGGSAWGADGNLWFTDFGGNEVGKITTDGKVTEYPVPATSSGLGSITLGPDGNLWFAAKFGPPNESNVDKITTDGEVTEYAVPTSSNLLAAPLALVSGPDGNLWFAESDDNVIAKLSPPGLCAYTLSADGQSFPPFGGTGSVTITTAPGCFWSVGSLPSWAVLTSPSSGTGSSTVTFQLQPNNGIHLTGSFTIAGQSFTIEQQAASIPGLAPVGSLAQVNSQGGWSFELDAVNLGSFRGDGAREFHGSKRKPAAHAADVPANVGDGVARTGRDARSDDQSERAHRDR